MGGGLLPLFQLLKFGDKEDALALCAVGWFHNPGGVWLASELLNEDVVVAWEDISLGDNIHLKVATKFVFFSKR